MVTVREGHLIGDIPYLAFGNGPPLVALPGLTGDVGHPTGFARASQLRPLLPLARHFTVHVLNRRSGLPPRYSLGDLADDFAAGIGVEFRPPVPVLGVSTGGSVALQLAADHPALVSRLVVVAAACRLSEQGRRGQQRLVELIEAGQPRRAWALIGRLSAGSYLTGQAMAAMLWLLAPALTPHDPSALRALVAAEDRFDLGERLADISAPTLLIGGVHDRYYSPTSFRRTALGITGAQLRLLPRAGHAGTITHRGATRDMVRFLTSTEPVQVLEPLHHIRGPAAP